MRQTGLRLKLTLAIAAVVTLTGCYTTRHVPAGETLLSRMTIQVDNDPRTEVKVKPSDLKPFVKQEPNHKVLGFWNLRLNTYNLSGRDTTRWYNRWLRRLGQPPVIYDSDATTQSLRQLRLALVNRGFMSPQVEADTTVSGRKTELVYRVQPGDPHLVSSIDCRIEDSALDSVIASTLTDALVTPGSVLDRNLLEAERVRITNRLRNQGYYSFVKDQITFMADTLPGEHTASLTMCVKAPEGSDHNPLYRVANVYFEPDFKGAGPESQADTLRYRNIYVVTPKGTKSYLKPRILWDNNYIDPGSLYSAADVTRTYEALSRLGMVKSVAITMTPSAVESSDSVMYLDATVRFSRNSTQGITAELEGTNSEGDLGCGVGLTYQHRNLFHASELLTIKARGSYESLSGNLEGLINNHYTEAGAEIALTLPRFRAPFIKRSFRRKVLANTEFALNFNFQERPEYTRIIAGAGWKYKWNNRQGNTRKVFDLIDVSYVYLPRSTINFLDEFAPSNPLLRYSYEDHFIMRMGFSWVKSNKRSNTAFSTPGLQSRFQRNIYTIRASAESAGNLLYAISNAVGQHKSDGAYKIFGIQYAQYLKAEGDYMLAHNFDSRSTIAFHGGLGVGVPYGNSSMLPFEKRFYAGGANSVRGWGVRALGPGRYDARNSVASFINQCGDIRIDLSAEYRVKLFWVFEGALFVDGGNVWTIRSYENQPDGMFRFSSFYKELAWAYGAGLRLDFTYFLLRFDLGIKAYNPAIGQQSWPLTHPDWRRDATFHFSVGYPF